jgi:methanogenic corrinoid protein MtbC1
MKEHIARGLSAAQAARLAVSIQVPSDDVAGDRASPIVDETVRELREALDAFDEARAQAALDTLLGALSVDAALRDAILPYLRELGERWARGDVTVAQEHFASSVVRGRLLSLGRGWGRGTGPRALLAAPPGELHDLGLVAFGLALRDRGWRIAFLGADTPIDTILDTAQRLRPEVVVLATLQDSRLRPHRDDLTELARDSTLVLAGAGTGAELAAELGAEHIPEGPIEAAEQLAAGLA